jgi:hypothetical protein
MKTIQSMDTMRSRMKIEMNKTVTVKEAVDIDLPYYYDYDVGDEGNYHVYGKIEENRMISITVTTYHGKRGFDIEISERHVSSCAEFLEFLTLDKVSSEAFFLAAKRDMLAAIQSA